MDTHGRFERKLDGCGGEYRGNGDAIPPDDIVVSSRMPLASGGFAELERQIRIPIGQ
jgi:hypothetical protein